MKTLLIILLALITNFISFSNEREHEKSPNSLGQSVYPFRDLVVFLYKKANTSKSDEFVEGDFYVYNEKKDTSYLLLQGVIIDKSEGWVVSNNGYVVLTIASIISFDEDRRQVAKLNFKENEEVMGGCYDKNGEVIYFLLKNNMSNQVGLHQFILKTNEIKTIIKDINILDDNVEAPFKKMSLIENGDLFIEIDCNNFYSVKLSEENNVRKVNYDNGMCRGINYGFNQEGLIYLKYKNIVSYELKQYNINGKYSKTLLKGQCKKTEVVNVSLLWSIDSRSFVVRIDNKNYLYDYKLFREIKVNNTLEPIFLSDGKIYYLNAHGKVNVVKY